MLISNNTAHTTSDKSRFRLPFRSPVGAAILVSIVLLTFHNMRFWKEVTAALWNGSLVDSLFIGSLFLVLLYFHAAVLLVIPGKRLFKATVATLFIIAAIAAYSSDTYGIFIDKDMIRNLFETDQREAGALLNLRFALYVLLLGIVPAALVWRLRLPSLGIGRQLLHRGGFIVCGLVLSVLMVFAFSANYSSFVREHKSVRYLLSPGATLQGSIQYARSSMRNPNALQLVDRTGESTRAAKRTGDKPVLMFLVIGETARARNFQLGGYDRPTNPELAKVSNLHYFSNVTSCGTSTAISLPCMFSHLGRSDFSVADAAHTTNMLDALAKAGVSVEWRDNNSGSKGVSARVRTINYGPDSDPELCTRESCYDEVMLKDLDQALASTKDDAVIVFHQIGSHGPAYANRYPPQFERFKPVCRTNELNRCSAEEIRNAYDNSIAYTDYNLARQIAILKSQSDRFDTLLIYVSDHGESLGEKGLYLHGAPYLFAPDDQKRVPFVAWMSDGYQQRFSVDNNCLRSQLGKPHTHDNLYHTVLGALTVKNAIYRKDLDMFVGCQRGAVTAGTREGARPPEL
jgi:lipid A ethanolaminephosphotransferase